MVSPQNPETGMNPGVSTTNRGFVSTTPEEGAIRTSTPALSPGMVAARSHVSWGAVIAGTLFTMAILLFSAGLAFACGVPAYSGGPYGWGAGVWSCITAIIAFFCGGCLAAFFAAPGDQRSGMLHGVMTWGLGLPLILALFGGFSAALFSHGGLMANNLVRMTVNGGIGGQPTWGTITGAAWGAWISLLLGLISAAVGGIIGIQVRRD